MSTTPLNTSLFAQVKGEVLFDTTLSDGAYRFYCLILYLSGKNTHCWYTQIELARFMGLKGKHADRSIRNYSKECESKGYIRVERPGYHKANKYYPLVKVPPQGKELSTNKGELSTPNYPPLQDRGQDHAIDRNQSTGKSHAPNNIQHERASSPIYNPIKGNINMANWTGNGKNAFLTAPRPS
jgi:hypothetical protein